MGCPSRLPAGGQRFTWARLTLAGSIALHKTPVVPAQTNRGQRQIELRLADGRGLTLHRMCAGSTVCRKCSRDSVNIAAPKHSEPFSHRLSRGCGKNRPMNKVFRQRNTAQGKDPDGTDAVATVRARHASLIGDEGRREGGIKGRQTCERRQRVANSSGSDGRGGFSGTQAHAALPGRSSACRGQHCGRDAVRIIPRLHHPRAPAFISAVFSFDVLAALNPKGIPSQSPGLRGTSYPGCGSYLNGVAVPSAHDTTPLGLEKTSCIAPR
jgi:hypothetical protein